MNRARLVVLASGGGRTIENLHQHVLDGRLQARIEVVIVSRGDCGAVARCQRLGLPVLVIGPANQPDRTRRNDLLIGAILEARPDFVVMAGWLQLLPIPAQLEGMVVNIHPALLPAYGGQGMYGHHVHAAVARDRQAVSGCTVHFATEAYDQGPVVLQEAVPLQAGMPPEAIAAAVFEAEKRVYPEALQALIEGHAFLENGVVHWV